MNLKRKVCLAPDTFKEVCDGTIVKAHTVPKSLSLQRISRNGLVYGFIPDLFKLNKTSGLIVPELIAISKASTFYGFCAKHDREIFAPLEARPFAASPEQCFLLAFRALSKELYLKDAAILNAETLFQLDRGLSFEEQVLHQKIVHSMRAGSKVGLDWLRNYKVRLDNMLIMQDYSALCSYVVEFSGIFPVTTSGAMIPDCDLAGNQFLDLFEARTTLPDIICISSVNASESSWLVFSWFNACASGSSGKLIRSFKETGDGRFADSMIRYFFEYSENIYIMPDWWEHLEEEKKQLLVNRFQNGTTPMIRDKACLVDDNTEFVDINVKRRFFIGPGGP